MCWMMPLTVGWKSSFMASQDILSIPCEDHFTKFTLQVEGVQVHMSGSWVPLTARYVLSQSPLS